MPDDSEFTTTAYCGETLLQALERADISDVWEGALRSRCQLRRGTVGSDSLAARGCTGGACGGACSCSTCKVIMEPSVMETLEGMVSVVYFPNLYAFIRVPHSCSAFMFLIFLKYSLTSHYSTTLLQEEEELDMLESAAEQEEDSDASELFLKNARLSCQVEPQCPHPSNAPEADIFRVFIWCCVCICVRTGRSINNSRRLRNYYP